jgi:hypothetical protein
LRYGDGTLYTRNAGDRRVFWQGPSVGFDVGGEGARTMMLVYNLPATDAIYQRFAGLEGSAYVIGGFGMTALGSGKITVVPIRSGVGLRLGANIGYLKFTLRRPGIRSDRRPYDAPLAVRLPKRMSGRDSSISHSGCGFGFVRFLISLHSAL